MRRPSGALQDAGGVEISRTALLSQEGSTIETAVEIVRGWFQSRTLCERILRHFVWGTTPRVIAKNAMTLPS